MFADCKLANERLGAEGELQPLLHQLKHADVDLGFRVPAVVKAAR